MSDDHAVGDQAVMQEMMRVMMAHHFSLRVAVTALIRTHPAAGEALAHFDDIAETLRTALLNSAWSEERIEEFERDLAGLRKDFTLANSVREHYRSKPA
ncbi:hypothetical protein DLREEDagrD3_26550 [Denitratisoma sp. agr-D3]